MFEAAEIGAKVSKPDYEAALPQLRTDLINAQFDLKKADFPGAAAWSPETTASAATRC